MALTEDDKQWLDRGLNGLKEYIDERLNGLKENIDERLNGLKEYIDERTHDAETRLLRGFADYNAIANVRFRKLEADASNLDTSSTLRLGELERQVADLHAKVISLEGRAR
jgi:hypothetical protein